MARGIGFPRRDSERKERPGKRDANKKGTRTTKALRMEMKRWAVRTARRSLDAKGFNVHCFNAHDSVARKRRAVKYKAKPMETVNAVTSSYYIALMQST
jgi:hypothetical protein